MIDLNKYRDKLICEKCGGSGSKVRHGTSPTGTWSTSRPCTCQDDERAVMEVVKPLVNFDGAVQAKLGGIAPIRLTDAWIALARMCVAREIEPNGNYEEPNPWRVANVIASVALFVEYTWRKREGWQGAWAGFAFKGIQSLAKQHGFDLDETIEERLG